MYITAFDGKSTLVSIEGLHVAFCIVCSCSACRPCVLRPELYCRVSWYPLNYRGHVPSSWHLTEKVLRVYACFAPFWPLQNLKLTQVYHPRPNNFDLGPYTFCTAEIGAVRMVSMCGLQVDLLHADLQPLQLISPQIVHLELASYHERLQWCTGAPAAGAITLCHCPICYHYGCSRPRKLCHYAASLVVRMLSSSVHCMKTMLCIQEHSGSAAARWNGEEGVRQWVVLCRLYKLDMPELAGVLMAAAPGLGHAQKPASPQSPGSQRAV